MLKKRNVLPAFALLEVAIALSILGVISYISLGYLKQTRVLQQSKITKDRQEKVMQALAGYVLIHHKLPCPAAAIDGEARETCTTVETAVGFIPYKSLGIPTEFAKDGCHQWMTYAVNTALTLPMLLKIDKKNDPLVSEARTFCGITDANTLIIRNDKDVLCIQPPDFAAVVIMAHGKSGGWYHDNGTVQPCNSQNAAKIANTRRQGTYYVKPIQTKGIDIFDDQIIFVSRYNLLAQWAQAPCQK